MSRRERTAKGAAAAALVALAAAGCAGARTVSAGDVPPDAVEQKAHTLTRQTLDAIRPALGGTPRTGVARARWEACTTETPGRHRYQYTYTVDVAVPESASAAVMTAARAHFTTMGYLLDPADGTNRRAGATLPQSTWTVRLGVKDASTTVIEAGSDCVFTTRDPRTGAG